MTAQTFQIGTLAVALSTLSAACLDFSSPPTPGNTSDAPVTSEVVSDGTEGGTPQTCPQGTSCDTGDPCLTNGVCDADGTCVGIWDPACTCSSNDPCLDGLACTVGACESGTCVFSPTQNACVVDGVCYATGAARADAPCSVCDPSRSSTAWSERVCDDNEPCTTDSCGPQGCVWSPNTDPCDDGKTCNGEQDVCSEGTCGLPCGQVCTDETDCLDPTAKALPACKIHSCISGECIIVDIPDGAACDGGPCVVGGTCDDGTCVGDSPCASACEKCQVNPQSTSHVCLPDPTRAGASCDDLDLCTVGDSCNSDGTCAGELVECGQYDVACSSGVCDPTTGTCALEPKPDTTPCDIGTCQAGACRGPWSCNSASDCEGYGDFACVVGTCDDNQCFTKTFAGTCFIDGVCYQPGDTNPENQCLICDPSQETLTWSVLSCAQDNPCIAETCEPAAGCVQEFIDGAVCGNCATGTCLAGACEGDCECQTDADCEAELPALEQCQRYRCQGYQCIAVADPDQANAPCDDGVFCTSDDRCMNGICTPAGVTDCSGSVQQCYVGVCDYETDDCKAELPATSLPCNDGDACTILDRCNAGTCSGQPLDCSGQNSPCATFLCTEGTCTALYAASGTPCEDGESCTLDDACTLDGRCEGTWDNDNCTCSSNGDCAIFGGPCETWYCDPSGACTSLNQLSGPCDDGNPCTLNDQCSLQGCSGTPKPCDDGIACTIDTCLSNGKCQNALSDTWCQIDFVCFVDGQTNPINPCQRCDVSVAQDDWALGSGACDDGDPCTSGDTCVGKSCNGAAYECDLDPAVLDCATSQCDGVGGCDVVVSIGQCAIEGQGCFFEGETNPDDTCLVCDPSLDPRDWSSECTSP